MPLYKYRSFQNWSRLLDIIINERLYASSYDKMNDPMEGHYYAIGLTEEKLHRIKEEKELQRICSLTTDRLSIPMWVFYADEGRGLCLEVEPTTSLWEKHIVQYGKMPEIKADLPSYDAARIILNNKLPFWEYEQERRFVNYSDDMYMPVKITNIFVGYNISKEDKELLDMIIGLVSKLRSRNIDIIEINKADLRISTVDDSL